MERTLDILSLRVISATKAIKFQILLVNANQPPVFSRTNRRTVRLQIYVDVFVITWPELMSFTVRTHASFLTICVHIPPPTQPPSTNHVILVTQKSVGYLFMENMEARPPV